MEFAVKRREAPGGGNDAPGKSRESEHSSCAWKTRTARGFPTFPPPRRPVMAAEMKTAEQKPLDSAAPFIDAPASGRIEPSAEC